VTTNLKSFKVSSSLTKNFDFKAKFNKNAILQYELTLAVQITSCFYVEKSNYMWFKNLCVKSTTIKVSCDISSLYEDWLYI